MLSKESLGRESRHALRRGEGEGGENFPGLLVRMLRLNTGKFVPTDEWKTSEGLSSSVANPPFVVLQPLDKTLFIFFRSDLA